MALILRTPRKKRSFTFTHKDGTTKFHVLNSELEAQVLASNLIIDGGHSSIHVHDGEKFLFEVTTSEEFYRRGK